VIDTIYSGSTRRQIEVGRSIIQLREFTSRWSRQSQQLEIGLIQTEELPGCINSARELATKVAQCGGTSFLDSSLNIGRSSHDVDVSAVGTCSALSGIVVGVSVRTSPLEVHEVAIADMQTAGVEVVLSTRVNLHNVSSLASHVQVVNADSLQLGRSGLDGEPVRAVLEGASELVRVDGQLELDCCAGSEITRIVAEDVDTRVVLEDVLTRARVAIESSLVTVLVGVEADSVVCASQAELGPDVIQSRVLVSRLAVSGDSTVDIGRGLDRCGRQEVGSVGALSQIGSGDVVAQTQNALVMNQAFRESHVVVQGEAISSVAVVVVTRLGIFSADGVR
jgi:hypothetical protein